MTLDFPRLLAKSLRADETEPPVSATLPGHLEDVTKIAVYLADRWGPPALQSLGLPVDTWAGLVRQALPRAAFLHDLGKANEHFQRMIHGQDGGRPQGLRHEWVSAQIVLRSPALGSWLCAGCDEVTTLTVLAAAVGHHLRLEKIDDVAPRPGAGLTMAVYTGHPDFAASLQAGARLLGLPPPPRLDDFKIALAAGPAPELRTWLRDSMRWWSKQTDEVRLFVGMVKALMIAADVAGSALPKQGVHIEGWIREALETHVCDGAILERVVRTRLAGQPLRAFQEEVATSDSRVTFVKAGCGTGKTAAAYAWAAQRAVGKKLFFCYPTTGTATEGFQGYVADVDGLEAELVHSRALVDLDRLLDNGKDDFDSGGEQHTARAFGLETWRGELTICTVDTVLGLLQNNRRGLFSAPAILNGAFVFDEIHQYDDALFDMLVTFLRTFRAAPILLMTASLPAARLNELHEALGERGERLRVMTGPRGLEELPRYEIAMADRESAHAAARAMGLEGGRVLWVSNTVDRCRCEGQHFGRVSGVLPYHARYRYIDRLDRHRDVMKAFNAPSGIGAIAVTTQVCEVSLDISADLLVTDLASVPALIQRMGRLNRRATPDKPGTPKRCLVLPVSSDAPYKRAEMELAGDWLNRLTGRPLSQSDLAREFEQLAVAPPERQHFASAWLNDGPLSSVGQLREPGYTVTIVREEDLAHSRPGARVVVENTIPMLLDRAVRDELRGWRREYGAYIAPAGRIDYSPTWGAMWR